MKINFRACMTLDESEDRNKFLESVLVSTFSIGEFWETDFINAFLTEVS